MDSSGFGHVATVTGPTLVSSRLGGTDLAYQFKGVSDTISVAHTTDLNLAATSSQFTLEAWIFPTEQKTQIVVRKGAGVNGPTASGFELALSATGDLIGGAEADSGLVQVRQSGYALNTWTHLAEVWNGTTLRLYVNAKEVTSLAFTGPIKTNQDPLLIGTRLGLASDTFHGMIDDVRLFSTARTQAELCADARLTGTSTVCP